MQTVRHRILWFANIGKITVKVTFNSVVVVPGFYLTSSSTETANTILIRLFLGLSRKYCCLMRIKKVCFNGKKHALET